MPTSSDPWRAITNCGLEGIPTHLIPGEATSHKRQQAHHDPARTQILGIHTRKKPGPPRAGKHLLGHLGRYRNGIKSYDTANAHAHAQALAQDHPLPDEAFADSRYQMDAAMAAVIAHSGIIVEAGSGGIRTEWNLATVEDKLLAIYYEHIGIEKPPGYFGTDHVLNNRITEGLWDASLPQHQIFSIAGMVYYIYVTECLYGVEMSGRIGWHLACWCLLSGDSGIGPSADHTPLWMVICDEVQKRPFKDFLPLFLSGMELIGSRGFRDYYFLHR